MRQNYLIEHTVGSIIRGAVKIYFRYFGTLFLLYVLPIVPAMVIQQKAQLSGNAVLTILSVVLTFTVALFAYGATTIAVSDVCIGNAPSIKRSYTKIFDKLVLRLLVTNILQILAIVVGFVLLVIPGLVLLVWLMLSPSIVVLEGRSGVAALKRSKQLGDGSHWRNAGLLLLVTIMNMVIGAVIGGVIGGVAGGAAGFLFHSRLETWFIQGWFLPVLTSLVQGFLMPISFISLILIYYDRRVRKEGYDAKALAEDLSR